MRAIHVTGYGDADRLELVEDDEIPEPGAGEVRIRVDAAGVNFADTLMRQGLYPGAASPPFVPGMEVAGEIDAVGDGVDRDEGERVAALIDDGGYAEYALAPAAALIDLPAGMNDEEAGGFPLQYLTAWGVLHDRADVEEGERVLIHAAAGGVGTAAVQLAREEGCEVYGTASTDEKLALAEELGCDHPINYEEEDFADRIDELTDGEGVDVVLDGVGGDVFDDSMDCLAHFGRLVTIGVASGGIPSADASRLLVNNQSVLGFHLGNALARRPDRVLDGVPPLREMLASERIEIQVGETHPLQNADEAHRRLENRETSGKVVLLP
jgi:NADPH2:quinone reductase